MSAQTPMVSAHWVYDDAHPGWSVRLDTTAWLTWLEEPTTTHFAYPLFDPAKGYIVGRMTVRKERRARGDAYWTAYRRTCGHLRKVYLGRSHALTHARLEATARMLREANDAGAVSVDQDGTRHTGGGLLFGEHAWVAHFSISATLTARPPPSFDSFDGPISVDRNISWLPFRSAHRFPFRLTNTPILGASTLEQLRDNIASLEISLTLDQLQRLSASSTPGPGDFYSIFSDDVNRGIFGGVSVQGWR